MELREMLMNVPQKSPTYTCISKRWKTVKINYRLPNLGAVRLSYGQI
ncbi:hypothetical protein [Candidatus Enterovibrio escicola]|nr:hypothetical protein [Candidatus Enterovibrio escacola]